MKTYPVLRWKECVLTLSAVVFLWMISLPAGGERITGKSHSTHSQEPSETLAITGTIKSEDGGPVKGAVVRAVDDNGEEVGRGISGAAGEYAVSGLPKGRYLVEVFSDDFAYSAKPKDCRRSVTIDFVLVKGKDVAGMVIDQFYSPMPNVEVWVEVYEGYRMPFPTLGRRVRPLTRVAEAKSDAQGRFTLRHLDYGIYQVRARADGYSIFPGEGGGQFLAINRLGYPDRLGVLLVPAATVKGTVRDPKGNPIKNATIRPGTPSRYPYEMGARLPAEGQPQSDANGRYVLTIARLSPGQQLSLSAYHPDYGTSDERLIMREVGSVQENVDFVLGIGRNAVSGIVTDSEGKPVQGAEVWADSEKKKVETDQKGRFRIENLPEGRFRASAHAEGYIDGTSAFFVLGGGLERTGVNILLTAPASIRGKVTDADGKPLGGATVRAAGWPDRETRFYQPYPEGATTSEATTDQKGSFVLTNLSGSVRYALIAMADGFAEKVKDDIRPDETQLTIALDKEARISGEVLDDETQMPVPGIKVHLYTPGAQGRFSGRPSYVVTDDQGRFSFGSLPSPSEYGLRVYGKAMLSDESQTISVEKGESKEDVIVYARPMPILSGIIREKDSQEPVANAVIGYRYGGVLALSDKKGEFKAVVGASWRFRVRTWRLVQEEEIEIPPPEQQRGVIKDVVLELVEGKVVKGKVTDRSNKPIAGAIVVPSVGDEEGGIKRVRSDSNGEFEIAGLPVEAQEVTVTAWHPQYAPAVRTAVFPGDVKVASIEFTMEKGGVIAGAVFDDSTKKPIAGARVVVSGFVPSQDEGASLRIPDQAAITDEKGAFRIVHLSLSGQYGVRARVGNFVSEALGNIVATAEDREEEIKIYLFPALHISGTVVAKDSGKPIEGAVVSCSGQYQPAVAKSGPDGKFTISDLEPGRYRLRVRAEDYCLPGGPDYAYRYGARPAVTVSLEARESVDDLKIELLKGGIVRGNVVDSQSRPVQGAGITLSVGSPEYADPEYRELYDKRATTDAKGEFEIRGLSPEVASFKVQATREEYAMAEETFALSAEELKKEVTLVMERGHCTVFGVVRKAEDEARLQGMRLTLRDSDQKKRFRSKSAVTDEDGKYKFENLAPSSTYRLSGSSGGIARLFGTKLIITTVENLVITKEDKSKELSLLAYKPFTITGIVREKESGEAVKGAHIQISKRMAERKGMRTCPNCRAQVAADSTVCQNCDSDLTWGRPVASTGTDDEGRFEFKDREEAEYKISVLPMLYRRGYMPGGRLVRGSQEITLKLGEVAPEFVLEVPKGLSISGVVQDSRSGEPVSGARVSAYREISDRRYTSVSHERILSDSEGRFTIPNLVEGRYMLDASVRNYSSSSVNVTLEKGKEPEPVVLQATWQASITVKVTDEEGKPIANAVVNVASLRVMGGREYAYTSSSGRKTGSDGISTVRLRERDASKFRIHAFHEDYGLTSVDLSPSQAYEEKETLVTLKKAPFASVSGTVTDEAGKPVQGVAVTVRPEVSGSSYMERKTTTNEGGKYSLKVLPDLTHSMTVAKDIFVPETRRSLTFSVDSPQTIDFVLAEGHVIAGKIVFQKGIPVSRDRSVRLSLRSADSTKREYINLDRGPNFEVKNLKEGTYDIEAQMGVEVERKAHTIYASAEGVETDTKDVIIKFTFDSIAGTVGALPPDLTLKDLEGKDVSLSDFKGKVVLVNFWATWVPSCMKEMAALEELYKEHKEDLLVVGIAVESDSEDMVKACVEKRKITYPVIMSTREILDAFEAAADEPIDTIPTTIIIGKGGLIKEKRAGAQSSGAFQRALESATALRR